MWPRNVIGCFVRYTKCNKPLSAPILRFSAATETAKGETSEVNRLSNVDDIVLNVKRRLGGRDDYNYDNLKRILSMLVEKKVPLRKLSDGFLAHPEAGMSSLGSWSAALDAMFQLGFTRDQALNVIFKMPAALGVLKAHLAETLDALNCAGIPSKKATVMIGANPEVLLMVSPADIRHRAEWLKECFSNKDVTKLCSQHPALFCQTEEELYAKIQYMAFHMGLEQPEMLKASVWSAPLMTLRVRHEFLVRLGIYVKPNPKAKSMCKNPSFKLIMDKSDKVFATKVAGVSPEEFEVFSKLAATRRDFLKFAPELAEVELDGDYEAESSSDDSDSD